MKGSRLQKAAVRFCAATLALLLPVKGSAVRAGAAPGPEDRVIVGYYGSWASAQGYLPQQLPVELLTHIHYAFASIDPEKNTAVLASPREDAKNLEALRALRETALRLKLLLSVGGWDGSAAFSDAASAPSRREAFAESCAGLVSAHRLDGVDLDWEYPVSGGAEGTGHRPEDRENFTLLLRAVRQALDRRGRQDGKRYQLTCAVGAGAEYLKKIEPEAVAETVDFLFLMGYDYHGSWDAYTDLNAPLYPPSGPSPQRRSGISESVAAYRAAGVPAEKLVLGMPLYGVCYQGVSEQARGLYSRYSSASTVPYNTLAQQYLGSAAYTRCDHPEAKVPWLFGNGVFLSFEDEASLAAKGRFAREQGLLGVGFWELSQDRKAVLVTAGWAGFTGSGFADVPVTAWYHREVEAVRELGLMSGTAELTFSPGRPLTRGMLIAILHRRAGSPQPAGECPYADVKADAYFRDAVCWAFETGIASGYGNGRFGPQDPVTREQLAAMLYRFAGAEGLLPGRTGDLSRFSDGGTVSAYAGPALAWAVGEGILTGKGAGVLDPKGRASRAEAAAVFARFFQKP